MSNTTRKNVDPEARSESLARAIEFARDRGTTTGSHPGTDGILSAAEKFYGYLQGETEEAATDE